MMRVTATAAIAAATALVSLCITALSLEAYASLVAGFIPARASGLFTPPVAALPVWVTPLTATLIHAGSLHLILNMVILVFTGRQVERALGGWGVLLLYLIGAYAAAAGQWLSGPEDDVRMVGASGAISALVGAYAMLYGQSRAKAIGPIPARAVQVVWLLLAWTGINLLMGVLSLHAGFPIAAAAHVGGFVAGVALARPLLLLRWRGA